MKRWMGLFLVVAAVSLAAQAPEGWRLRIDRSTSASDPDDAGNIKFTLTGMSFHAVNPQAAVYWHPSNVATGTYILKGTFTLMKPSPHINYYGLVFGGSELEGATQRYLYFMVAQDRFWMLKRRDGEEAPQIATGPHPAVHGLDAKGQSVNTLEVRVGADTIAYVVNGTVVHSTPKSGETAKTDGIYGFRVNHLLDVVIDGFGKS